MRGIVGLNRSGLGLLFYAEEHSCAQNSGLPVYPGHGLTGALQCIVPKQAAIEQGYDDILCVDAKYNTYLEEVSASNIFVVQGDTVRTPSLAQGTFLEGWQARDGSCSRPGHHSLA